MATNSKLTHYPAGIALDEEFELLRQLGNIVFAVPHRARLGDNLGTDILGQFAPMRQHGAAQSPHEGFVFAGVFEGLALGSLGGSVIGSGIVRFQQG